VLTLTRVRQFTAIEARSSRRRADIILLLLVPITIAGLLLTFAGYAAKWRYLEITADYRPYQQLLGGLCLAGGFAAYRRRANRRVCRLAVIGALVIIVVNGLEVFPVVLARRPTPEITPRRPQFKAMAFNVEGSNNSFDETRAFVERELPDVVMFSEATARWSEELKPLSNILPQRVREDEMEIEVLARHPILRKQAFHFGAERGLVLVLLEIDGSEVGFVAVHTYPRQWRGAEGYQQRTLALEKGLGKQSHAFPRPLLVMGDFNASQWTPAYKTMLRGSELMDAEQGFGLIATHHGQGLVSQWFWSPIDHCLHSRDVTVNNYWHGPDLGSDHLPILVDFSLPQPHEPILR
jgi:endonuclease/exonuclease/phosphatase (EEP) superfamily protein YafD